MQTTISIILLLQHSLFIVYYTDFLIFLYKTDFTASYNFSYLENSFMYFSCISGLGV